MLKVPVSLAIATVSALAGLTTSVPASASPDWGINGTYTATSNGELARKNDAFYSQASLRSTWTVATQCSYPGECTGTVQSEWGWSAPIYQKSGVWYVKHTVDNWIPCPDGSTAPGLQVFRFKAMTLDGTAPDPASNTLVGEDITSGPSGACGVNKAVYINMPFKLTKVN